MLVLNTNVKMWKYENVEMETRSFQVISNRLFGCLLISTFPHLHLLEVDINQSFR